MSAARFSIRSGLLLLLLGVGSWEPRAGGATLGEPVWTFSTGGSLSGCAISPDGTVVFGSADGNLYAVGPDGLLKWTNSFGGASCSTPSVGIDGTVYFSAAISRYPAPVTNGLFAVDAGGQLRWRIPVNAGLVSGVAIGADGILYASTGDYYTAGRQALLAISPAGSNLWAFANGRNYDATPAIGADGTIYIGSTDGRMHALRRDGTLLWECNTGDGYLKTPVINAQGVLFTAGAWFQVINSDGQLLGSYPTTWGITAGPSCLDPQGNAYAEGELTYWRLDLGLTNVQKFALPSGDRMLNHVVRNANGTLYLTTYSGIYSDMLTGNVYATTNGAKHWEYSLYQVTFGSATLGANNTLYVPGSDGRLYAFSTEAGLDNSAWPHWLHDPQHTARATQIPPAPAAPTPLSATYRTRVTDVRLAWPSVPGAAAYELFRSVTTNLADATLLVEITGRLTHDDSTASPEIAYAYWIRAKNAGGLGAFAAPVTGMRRQAVPGELLYEFLVGGPVTGSPAIGADGTIYVGVGQLWTNGQALGNKLAALRADGTFKWQYPLGGAAQSAPTLAPDGTIYLGVPTGVTAFNPDGTKRWDFVIGSGVASTPALAADGTLYFGCGNGKLYALSGAGQPIWTNTIGAGIDASPAIGPDGAIYIPAQDGWLYAVSPDSTLRWRTYCGHNPDVGVQQVSVALAEDGSIAVSGGPTGVSVFWPDGTLKWRSAVDYFTTTPVLDSAGRVYVGAQGGTFYCLGPGSSTNWTYPIGGYQTAAAAVSQSGFVYSVNYNGRLVALGLDGAKSWELQLSGSSRSAPAIAPDGTLYIGTDDGKVVSACGAGALAASPWPMFQRDLSHTARATNAPAPPGPPSFVTASDGLYNNRVRITWSNAPNAWYYELWRSPTVDPADGALLAGRLAAVSSFDDFTAPEGVTNFYLIRAGNSLGLSAFAPPDSGYRRVAVPGEVVAEFKTSGCSAASVGLDGGLLVSTGSRLCGLTPELAMSWYYPSNGSLYGTMSPPVVGATGTIYLTVSGDSLRALNPDGTLRWKTNNYTALATVPPAVGSNGTIFWASSSRLYAFRPDATEMWEFPCTPTTPLAIGGDGTVYFGAGDRRFYAVSASGQLLWRFSVSASLQCAPAVGPDGTVYFGCDDYRLYAVSLEGVQRWSFLALSALRAPPVIGPDGTIVFGGTDGTVFALRQDGIKKWQFKTDGAVSGGPAIATDGTIFVGTAAGSIYALGPAGGVMWQSTNHATLNTSALLLPGGRLVIASSGLNGSLIAVRTLNAPASLHWPMAQHDAQRTAQAAASWLQPSDISSLERLYSGESLRTVPLFTLPDRAVVRAELWVGTNLVSVATNVPFALAWTNAVTGTNQLFTRVIDDLGCAYRSVPLTVIATALTLQFSLDTAGCATLSASTLPGHQYSLESTTNLLNWQPVEVGPTNSPSLIQWTLDPISREPGLKAYRLETMR